MVVGGGGWLVVGWCLLGVMAGVVAGGGGWLACGWLVVAGGGGWLVTAGGSSGGWWGLDRIPSDKLPSAAQAHRHSTPSKLRLCYTMLPRIRLRHPGATKEIHLF